MISDNHIFFYVAGFILLMPILMGVAYSLLKSLGIAHPLLLAIIGTPFLIWLAAWIWSLIDDVGGHIDGH